MKSDFLLAIAQLAAERNLPKEVVFEAVEAALLSTYRKDSFVGGHDLSVGILPASGEIKVFAIKTVVESPSDTFHEISLADARKIDKAVNLGETVRIEIHPPDAGRIGAQTAKQIVVQRLSEAERNFIFGEFAHREGDIIAGVVQQADPRHVVVGLGKAEGVLPPAEQVRTERYRAGQRLKFYLLEASQTNRGLRLILSRTHPNLVRRLFQLEIPEIHDGVVELKGVAREPGFRTKLAVATQQEGVDAVGCCVGLRGIRIQNIVNELQGEKIDVIQWNAEPKAFVANALSPARVLDVAINQEERMAVAVVPDGHLSLAIGREGQNARLAAKLTGWKIDIKSATVAEEERRARVLQEPAEEEKAEETAPEFEETEEEVIPIEAVLDSQPQMPEAPQIRFAEEIFPHAARAVAKTTSDRKDYAERREKVKGKKAGKLRLPMADEEDEDV